MTSVLDEQLLRIGLASEIERGSAVLPSRVVEGPPRRLVDRRRQRPRREWFTVETGPEGQFVGYTGPDGSSIRWKL
ncbi:hypothetical protein [Kitasatospora sp. NPDC056731]|uniref:hypothetical protein n=1 Tax=Kitasatospora sp. NPDC056731 TaxID=3155422 RepID=UPI00343D81CA